MKIITITRKIQILIDGDKEYVRNTFKTLYDWNEKVFRAANIAVTHMYFQEKQKEFSYLTEGAKKLLLVDENSEMKGKVKELVESGEGVPAFNTSKQNTTYRLLSSFLKGDVPSDIFSNLNAQLAQTFSSESKEYFSGKRSLRSYRRGMPMPISAKSVKNIEPTEDKKNYYFTLYGLKFKTYFGKDLSGNKKIWDSAQAGHYKFCNSSIQLDGNKIFLLAVFQFDATELKADGTMYAELSIWNPIVAKWAGKQEFKIGDRDEFLYQRLAIQAALRRAQIAAKYTTGGRGRKKKLHNIDHFKGKEKRYIQNKLHQYSSKLVELCVKNKCGKLILKHTPNPIMPEGLSRQEQYNWRKENEFLLRNWSYYGLNEKLKYKCDKVGVKLVVEQNT